MSLDRIRELQQYVNNGCDYLDSKVADWHTNINLESLDISSCCRCVLGQLFGNYIDRRSNFLEDDIYWDASHGFTLLNTPIKHPRFTILTILWIETIAKRYRGKQSRQTTKTKSRELVTIG